MNPKLHFKRQYIPVLATFSGKDDIREVFNGFHIKPHPQTGVILTATDGHRLVTIHDKTGASNGEYTFPISKELLAACKKSQRGKIVACDTVEIANCTLRLHLLDGFYHPLSCSGFHKPVLYMEHIRPIEAPQPYPNAASVLGKFTNGAINSIALNMNYMRDLQVLSQTRQCPVVKCWFSNKDNALVAIGGMDNEIVAMVMPARDPQMDAEFSMPEFTQYSGHIPVTPTDNSDTSKEAA